MKNLITTTTKHIKLITTLTEIMQHSINNVDVQEAKEHLEEIYYCSHTKDEMEFMQKFIRDATMRMYITDADIHASIKKVLKELDIISATTQSPRECYEANMAMYAIESNYTFNASAMVSNLMHSTDGDMLHNWVTPDGISPQKV